jgi:hypothetical protein
VAYLINALIRGRDSNSPVYGFAIFVVGQGGNTPEQPTIKYRVDGQEDAEISVDGQDENAEISLAPAKERLLLPCR